MFIDPAYAQGAPAGADPFTGLLIPMLLMILIFYFLVIRPQSQRAAQHKEMVEKVRRGDTVVTSGGFVGKVTKAGEDGEIEVEIADGVKVKVIRSMIAEVRSKGEPVKSDAA